MLTVEFYLLSLLIAIFSYVFCELLTEADMLLNWYYKLIDNIKGKIKYPLGYCSKCFAGQIALWVYFKNFDYLSLNYYISHILFITLTIFITYTISQIWNKIQEN